LHLVCGVMGFAVILAMQLSGSFQPWYLLYFLTFAAFLSNRYYVTIPAFILSASSLLNYAPFLYLGNWNEAASAITFRLNVGGLLLSLIFIILHYHIRGRVLQGVKKRRLLSWIHQTDPVHITVARDR